MRLVAARSAKPRIGDVHLEDRRHLVWNAVDQLRQGLGAGNDAGNEVIHLVRVGRNFLRRLDADDRERLGLRYTFDDEPAQSLERDLNRLARQVDPLVDASRDPNPADESLRIEHVIVVARRDDESYDQPGLLVRLEQGKILRSPHLHRDGAQRVHDCRSKRHERQRRW